jgi:multimeric flavodoxin WrbA
MEKTSRSDDFFFVFSDFLVDQTGCLEIDSHSFEEHRAKADQNGKNFDRMIMTHGIILGLPFWNVNNSYQMLTFSW